MSEAPEKIWIDPYFESWGQTMAFHPKHFKDGVPTKEMGLVKYTRTDTIPDVTVQQAAKVLLDDPHASAFLRRYLSNILAGHFAVRGAVDGALRSIADSKETDG